MSGSTKWCPAKCIVRAVTCGVLALTLWSLGLALAGLADPERFPLTTAIEAACRAFADSLAAFLACFALVLLCLGLKRLGQPVEGVGRGHPEATTPGGRSAGAGPR